MGHNETSKAYRIYVPGQREVELIHDVTFDEDFSLTKVQELPIPKKENGDADAKKQDEPLSDVPMPDVEPIPLIHLLVSPLLQERGLCGSNILLKMLRNILHPRGTFRESKKLNRYQGYLATMSTIVKSKPCTFEEDVKHQVWKDAMNKEYDSIMKNDVWDVVPRPKGKFFVTSKWLYKIKHGANGSVEKFKARFVARGFSQREGVDYDEIFAPVSRYTIVHSIIALFALKGWRLH